VTAWRYFLGAKNCSDGHNAPRLS